MSCSSRLIKFMPILVFFAAAVSDRSISNLVSFSGSTNVIEPVSHYCPGNFWDQPEARWERAH